MRVPVGAQAAARASRRLPFACGSCGHKQLADVVGVGEGVESFLNADGTAERRARADAEKDLARTLRLARCPKCGRRNGEAVYEFFSRPAVTIVGFTLLGAFVGFAPTWFGMNMRAHDKEMSQWLLPLLFGVSVLLVVPFSTLAKWSTIDARVKWVEREE